MAWPTNLTLTIKNKGLMRTLTPFGKRVFAIAALILAIAVILFLGYFVLADKAYRFHVNQQAFNVIVILTVLPVCCMVIAHVICFIRESRLA